MKLEDYPVPENNNKFGYHLFPFQQDLQGRDEAFHRWPLEQTIAQGGQWVCMISSPGGDTNWPGGRPGSCEWSFEMANEMDLWIMVRIYTSSEPPYWTPAIEKNLEQLVSIASGRPFYIKFNNEIDAEWRQDHKGAAIHYDDAQRCCVGIGQAIDQTWDRFNGLVIPSFLNTGYGGDAFRYFEIMHEVGMGDRLDRCWIPVHPYAGAWESLWPWSSTLLEPILYTPETYAQHSRWQWKLDKPDRRTLEMVNEALMVAHEQRMPLESVDDLIAAYAYGFFTYIWALHGLHALGHTETPLLFPEWGTRVGEDWVCGPKVDINVHSERTIEQIGLMQKEKYILGGANWILDTRGGVQPNWKDQGIYCEYWDPSIVNMEPDLEVQVVTPGRLRLADELLAEPVGEGKGEEKVMSKLYFHIQEYRSEVKEALRRSQPEYVKVMGAALKPETINDIKSLIPGVRIIGRYHVEDQSYEDDPEGRAQDLVSAIAEIGCGSLVWAWEDYNEIPYSHMPPNQVDAYDRFMYHFHNRVKAQFGVEHTIVINSPVGNLGWPGEVSPAEFERTLTLPGTIISFHCYERWKEPGARPAYLFRWEELIGEIESKFVDKQYLLTETGVTRATISGEPDVGWRSEGGYSREDYMDILRAQERRMDLYDEVLGACVFQTGGAGDWATFESTKEVADLRLGIEPLPPQPPQPPTPGPGEGNQAQEYGVVVTHPAVEAGEEYWKAISVTHYEPCPNNWRHHLFIDAENEDGLRAYNQTVLVSGAPRP